MKRRSAFLWVAFAAVIAFSACGPYIQTSQTLSSALVKIECRNASVQQILLLLRSGRGKDITVIGTDPSLMITVAFSPVETPAWRLAQIINDLQEMSGVLSVNLQENPRPIMQSF